MEEKRIMKKSTLLSLATAGAIVATSVGTFAAWDTLDAVSSNAMTIQYGEPIVLSIANVTSPTNKLAPTDSINGTNTVIGKVNLSVAGLADTTNKQIKLTAVSDSNGTPLDLSTKDISVGFSDGTTDVNSGEALDIKSNGAATDYDVKITMNENVTSKNEAKLPTVIYVKAELVDKAGA